ncbi:MAG: acyl-CoA dehydrogenase family protein [Sandaracinus sp.]|nr:acyl-CoA dehydrogenase family protein [Sandaracinus sp.]MCB9616501.1 acyl-CoA dehydrogenase family protein [Sandaracinus sp.]MCB9635854.1 acyl-CoA dehydrogenase family protein [Sandaracinus sp.]
MTDLVERAARAATVIAPYARAIETERRLPPEVIDALVEAGLFKALVPKEHGGGEHALLSFLDAVETIAAADGSAGWCAMIGGTSGLMAAYLAPDAAQTLFGDARAISAGVFAPFGKATPVEGGYRVTGRWPFASGCQHATHVMGGAMIAREGRPEMRSMIFGLKDVRVQDTWDVVGLRGTGSHDFEVEDAFVPEARTLSLFGKPRHEGALYRQPLFGALAAGVASVTIGIARGALDALVTLARTKRIGPDRTMATRELVQRDVGVAWARVDAAKATLVAALEANAAEVARQGEASLSTRARLRLAACHAAKECAQVVDVAYEHGGGAAIYAGSSFQRAKRDVHVATQHLMVSGTSATLAGRALLGLEGDYSAL